MVHSELSKARFDSVVSSQEALRVLHVSPDLSPRLGGSVTASIEICKALARLGVKVSLLSTDIDEVGRWSPIYRPHRLNVVSSEAILIDGVRIRYFPTVGPSRFAFSPEMIRAMRVEAKLHDVLHIHRLYRFPSLMAARVARRFTLPYVVSPHGVLQPYHRRRRQLLKSLYDSAIQRRDLNSAAAVLYTSELEKQLASGFGVTTSEVVVPAGVNLSDFRARPTPGSFRRLHPECSGKQLVTFLGRLAPQKGLDLLIRAFALVRQSVKDAHLVIAGPDEDGHLALVRSWIAECDLSSAVTIVGPIFDQDKLSLLADTDVWVLSSYAENFGIAVVEALAMGLPVVITDRVGIHKDVSDAGAGIVVRCDVEELGVAITTILTNEELSHKLRQAGPRLVESRFTWDQAARRMLGVYERTVRLRSHRARAVG